MCRQNLFLCVLRCFLYELFGVCVTNRWLISGCSMTTIFPAYIEFVCLICNKLYLKENMSLPSCYNLWPAAFIQAFTLPYFAMIPAAVPCSVRSVVPACMFLRFGKRTTTYLPIILGETQPRAIRVYLTVLLDVLIVSSFLNCCGYFTKTGEYVVCFGGDRGLLVVFHQFTRFVACSMIFKIVRKNPLSSQH